ncbi:unnamed protein product [Caenorhabditis angaria]|uniref:Serpentine receptor class gamma n=1 Tax=Caenorhabditis angaria TaxID=860376 RepID=A0A9P1J3W2_9PELO|nr:unnamed protein product [Caenorhabditis angaria]
MSNKSIFHLATFLLCVFTCYQDSQLVKGDKLPIKNNFWSRFVFLTNVDLYLQAIYHLIAFLLSISGVRRNSVFDYFARTIIGPLGVATRIV